MPSSRPRTSPAARTTRQGPPTRAASTTTIHAHGAISTSSRPPGGIASCPGGTRSVSPAVKEIEDYVRSLGLDAYLVGGAVRDELLGHESKDADFLVPGVDTEGLRAAL